MNKKREILPSLLYFPIYYIICSIVLKIIFFVLRVLFNFEFGPEDLVCSLISFVLTIYFFILDLLRNNTNNNGQQNNNNNEQVESINQNNTSSTKGPISPLTAVLLFIPLTTFYFMVSGIALILLIFPLSGADGGGWVIPLIVCPIISPILAIIHLSKMMSIKKDNKTKNNENKYIHNNYQA